MSMELESLISNIKNVDIDENDYQNVIVDLGLNALNNSYNELEQLEKRVDDAFKGMLRILRKIEKEAVSDQIDHKLYKSYQGGVNTYFDILESSLKDYAVCSNLLGEKEGDLLEDQSKEVGFSKLLKFCDMYVIKLDSQQQAFDRKFDEVIKLCEGLAKTSLSRNSLCIFNPDVVKDALNKKANTLRLMQLNFKKEVLLKRIVNAVKAVFSVCDFKLTVDVEPKSTYKLAFGLLETFDRLQNSIVMTADNIQALSSCSNIDTSFINRGIKMTLKSWKDANESKVAINDVLNNLRNICDKASFPADLLDYSYEKIINIIQENVRNRLTLIGEDISFDNLSDKNNSATSRTLESVKYELEKYASQDLILLSNGLSDAIKEIEQKKESLLSCVKREKITVEVLQSQYNNLSAQEEVGVRIYDSSEVLEGQPVSLEALNELLSSKKEHLNALESEIAKLEAKISDYNEKKEKLKEIGVKKIGAVIDKETVQERDIKLLFNIGNRLGRSFPKPTVWGVIKAFFIGFFKPCGYYDNVMMSSPNFNGDLELVKNYLNDDKILLTPKNVAGFFNALLHRIENIKRSPNQYFELKKSIIEFHKIAKLFLVSKEIEGAEFVEIKHMLTDTLERFGELSYKGSICNDILTADSIFKRWVEGFWGPSKYTISEYYLDELGTILNNQPFQHLLDGGR